MASSLRDVVRLLAGGVLLGLLVHAAHVRLSDPRRGAVLRLAVRTTAGTAVACRQLGPDELAALPAHMRRPEVCETRATPYRLQVTVSDHPRLDRLYRAAGIRGDRPLTIDEVLSVAPGLHRVRARLVPADGAAGAEPRTFSFDAPVEFPEGRIRILALEGDATAFTVR